MASLNGNFSIPNFLGGINENLDEMYIAANESKALQNVDVEDGALKSSLGTTLYNAATLNSSLDTLMSYYKNNTGILIVASNGKLYKLSGTSFVEIASGFTSNNFDYVNFNVNDTDIIIFTNGVDNVKIYDNTTIRDLKMNGYNSTEGPTNIAPKGKFCDIHYERLWLADEHSLYYSTVNRNGIDIEDFTAPTDEVEYNNHGGQIDVYTNDGTKIIGLKVIFDDVMIFKEKSIFKIFGSSPANYTKIQIFSSNGAIADKSIQVANNGAFFCNKDGIYTYDGTNVRLISQKLKKTFSNLNLNALNNAVAKVYKNKYILAVPEGSSSFNNLVIEYNLDTKAFTFKRGFNVSSFVEFNDMLLFTNETGKIYEYNLGTTIDGQPIISFYETGSTDLGTPDGIKEVDSIYFTAKGIGDIKIKCITEKNTKEKTLTLSSTDKIYKVKLKNRGRLLKYRFENINGSSFNIRSVKIICDVDMD